MCYLGYFVVQAERALGEEEAGDRQLRAEFGPMWSRTPSEMLSGPIRHELAKYRSIISNAASSDGMMRQRFNAHRNGIMKLSQSDVRNRPPSRIMRSLVGWLSKLAAG